jgi:RNA polymerase sigma-54 factor
MKQSLQLRLGQSLTMTPQLQQAIRLLQLSTMELNMEVQRVLESNVMLDMVEDEEEFTGGASGDQAVAPADINLSEQNLEPRGSEETLALDIPEELPVDGAWEDIYDAPLSFSGSDEVNGAGLENQRGAAETLEHHLLWQINLLPIGETDKVIALTIVDALDKNGYLRLSLEEICLSLNQDADMEEVGLDEVKAVLHRVQSLDPPGVAARDLGQCLQLQLAQRDPSTPWRAEAQHLIGNYLNLLAAHDYTQLMRRMKLSKEQLQQIIALIQSLNPRPGAQFTETPVEYVAPDVYVRKQKGIWQVELNPDTIPHLRINPYYANMIRTTDRNADTTSLKAQVQEARWFIKSIQSRSETLLRVATTIVERQRAFLEYGEEAMKPLVLHDIAEALGMHESTISRVTTRKYIHTPRGIYELKYFFSSHVSTTAGGDCSSTAIRAVIKKLIAAENPQKPLSDSKIAAVLSDQGIQVARRTVAKYREAMAIPPSNERKRLA